MQGLARGARRVAAVVGVMLASCGGAQSEKSADQVIRFLPATLEVARPRPGEPRSAKVRVYADPGIRALLRWREDITEEIDYANQLLTPLVGVRLVVESIKDWPREGEPGAALRDLAALDKGDDVAWVIGFVTPPDTASAAMSELGDAQPLGHHLVVRGWNEKPEADKLAGRLPELKSGERTEVLGAHRRHKQTVVLLHMLATSLGAIAEADPTWIQHALYSPKQNSFANRTREVLQLAIDARIASDPEPVAAQKLLTEIEKNEWGGWIPASRDEVVATLRRAVDAAKSGKTFATVPPAAYEQMQRITELAKHGQLPEAQNELDNLLTAYPGNAGMHELKCEIMLAKPGVADKATRAACAHVTELAPGDPTVHLAVAEALMKANDAAGARAELVIAEGKIANLATGAQDAWRRAIAIYVAMGALTWTEEAIAKAGLTDDPAAASVAVTRTRYGVAKGAKFVQPAQEAALVSATRRALDLVYANKFGEAQQALAKAERSWPSAPGLVAVRCDLAFRMGQIDAARATCARARSLDPRASWALYLEGVLLLRDAGTTATGIARLKQAIEVDPGLGQAWRTLGKAYARGKDKAAYDQLNAAYLAKFGQGLPP